MCTLDVGWRLQTAVPMLPVDRLAIKISHGKYGFNGTKAIINMEVITIEEKKRETVN